MQCSISHPLTKSENLSFANEWKWRTSHQVSQTYMSSFTCRSQKINYHLVPFFCEFLNSPCISWAPPSPLSSWIGQVQLGQLWTITHHMVRSEKHASLTAASTPTTSHFMLIHIKIFKYVFRREHFQVIFWKHLQHWIKLSKKYPRKKIQIKATYK